MSVTVCEDLGRDVHTFLTSNRFFSSPSPVATFLVVLGAASVISTSAMMMFEVCGGCSWLVDGMRVECGGVDVWWWKCSVDVVVVEMARSFN